jgi:hypothetical protein
MRDKLPRATRQLLTEEMIQLCAGPFQIDKENDGPYFCAGHSPATETTLPCEQEGYRR